jgi:hypothetical protein
MSERSVLLDRTYHRKYSFSFRRFPEFVLFGDMLETVFGFESVVDWRACAARYPSECSDICMVCTVHR